MGPTSYKLVYKPHYRYIYHKPYVVIEVIGTNLDNELGHHIV